MDDPTPRKVRAVFFYHANPSSTWSLGVIAASYELNLPISDCFYNPIILTEVTISSLHLHKLSVKPHLPDPLKGLLITLLPILPPPGLFNLILRHPL